MQTLNTTLDELDRELAVHLATSPLIEMGLSKFLGNSGRWCTLTVECMPNCS